MAALNGSSSKKEKQSTGGSGDDKGGSGRGVMVANCHATVSWQH